MNVAFINYGMVIYQYIIYGWQVDEHSICDKGWVKKGEKLQYIKKKLNQKIKYFNPISAFFTQPNKHMYF